MNCKIMYVYKLEVAINEFRSLKWFQIHRGAEEAGELLAAFEMLEVHTPYIH